LPRPSLSVPDCMSRSVSRFAPQRWAHKIHTWHRFVIWRPRVGMVRRTLVLPTECAPTLVLSCVAIQ
jgi:hypothetical protein